jgi:hypothetical protein
VEGVLATKKLTIYDRLIHQMNFIKIVTFLTKMVLLLQGGALN